MKYKGFTLDRFQEDAVKYIDKGFSVVVSAATGTGKTLIAEYLISKYLPKNRRIVYTAPIKALSNQKYRDFVKEYGEESIGIMTGDVVINPEAMILIMTTEIYRNMLLSEDEMIEYIDYVIFDEIHYINDIERGTVWEESIIFSPKRIRFLCLSATIPNAKEFAEWISQIKKQEVKVVNYEKRAVPLKHYFFDTALGIVDFERLNLELGTPDYEYIRGRQRHRKKQIRPPNHIELIKQIKDKLPALFFVFSRKMCEKKAIELSQKLDFLRSGDRQEIIQTVNSIISSEYRSLESVRNLKEVLSRGIGFHHAGLLPCCKEAVEKLFGLGLIHVLYATETFAVGINYPAKSVCFSSLHKYDGINFRYMFTKEYFQMAGRAGRRGIDNIGYVYVMIDRRDDEINRIKQLTSKDIEPIKSQYKLSVNTVINMIHNYHNDKQRELILKSSFDYFQKKKKENIRIMARFNNLKRKLEQLGFIKENSLTQKGLFARRIYDKEILVTNLFTSELYKHIDEDEMNVLAAAIIYEPGKDDKFDNEGVKKGVIDLLEKIKRYTNQYNHVERTVITRIYKLIGEFSGGQEFKEIIGFSNLQEGDIIRLFRRTIDLLRQIRHATLDNGLKDKCSICIEKIDRVPVKVEF